MSEEKSGRVESKEVVVLNMTVGNGNSRIPKKMKKNRILLIFFK
jgi:hypothetical protein